MMPWTFIVHLGQIIAPNGERYSAYSGHGPGLNNPALEHEHNIGPIPRGLWFINPPINSPMLGPFALPLIPKDPEQTFARSGFFIHGDSSRHPGEASHGCIITHRQTRIEIADSPDTALQVT